MPSADELAAANWEDAVQWNALDREYVLINSAEDLRGGISDVEHQSVILPEGGYEVVYAEIIGTSYGQFHRFRLSG